MSQGFNRRPFPYGGGPDGWDIDWLRLHKARAEMEAVLRRQAQARAQTGQAPPPAPPELREQAPRATSPDEPAAVSEGAGSLSERLERSEGVIAPADPGTDPGIVRPTPDAGASAMPVIPPPGGPGGDPNVRPK